MASSKFKEEIKNQNAGILNKIWGFWKTPIEPSEKTEKTRAYITVNPSKSTHLEYKGIKRIKYDEASGLLLMNEKKGRLLLVDVKRMTVVRLWTGARDSFTTFCKMGKANYAMIFYLQRGLLELYRLRHGYKVFSKYIGKNLLFFDSLKPTVFANDMKLYQLEFEESSHKISLDEEDFKRLYMEEFMIQDDSGKEMYAMNEIVAYAQGNPKELKKEYIKSHIKKIKSHNFLHALYEKVFENSTNPEITLYVIDEIIKKYTSEEEKVKETIELMNNRCRIIKVYIELFNTSIEKSKEDVCELDKWLKFYEHILSHEVVSLVEKPKKSKITWREFVNRAEKNEWNEDMGLIMMKSLSKTHETLIGILKLFNISIENIITWFINWLSSICNYAVCDCSKCELWNICRTKRNPVYNFLETIFKKDPELLEKYKMEKSNKAKYYKQIADYCLNSSNLLHILILSNMLKEMDVINVECNFGSMEKAAKFYLLILSNIKDLAISPFTFAQKISFYEFIAKDQLARLDIGKTNKEQLRDADKVVTDFLKRDKLSFSLELDGEKKLKDFYQYLKNLDINDDYFQAGLIQSQVPAMNVRDQALKLYKDPIFLLCKLTTSSKMIKPIITLERLWEHAQRYMNKGKESWKELDEVRNEYLYLDNVALRVGVFIKIWKKAFASKLLNWILPQAKHKEFAESNISKKSLSTIYELLVKFQEDVKEVKKKIQNYIETCKDVPKETEVKDKFTENLLSQLYKLSFKEEITSDAKSFEDIKTLNNKLYDPVLLNIKEILWEEVSNYWKYCAYNKIEKEYVITNGEDLKVSPKKLKPDTFYKQATKLIKLAICIFQARQKINEHNKQKHKHKHVNSLRAFNQPINKILSVDETILRNAILMNKEITKKVLEKIKKPNLDEFNKRIPFLANYMKLDSTKAFELCKNIGTDVDNILEYNIKEDIRLGNDKEVETYISHMQSKDALGELMINCLEERIAEYLKGKKKVDIELLQLPNLERYSKFDTQHNKEIQREIKAESIERLLKMANKYVTESNTNNLSSLEDDVKRILSELPK